MGLFAMGALAAVNMALARALRHKLDRRSLRRLGWMAFAADTAVLFGMTWLTSFAQEDLIWEVLYILMLEGAVRGQMTGAMVPVAVAVPLELGRGLWRQSVFGFPFYPRDLVFRVGIMAIVAAIAGARARHLKIERQLLAKARDEALQASRMKSDFLANMSHEIRTPLNAVIGMTGLLLDTHLKKEQREYAETVRNSGEGLLEVVNDVLDFSKIEADKVRLELLDFHLGTVVAEVPDMLAARALVLVAEDNPVNQKVTVRMLEKLGHHADVVANGREALDALDRISYAAVFMDFQMPEMDGIEATLELRRREGDGRRTPVIAMTAAAMPGDRERCLQAGMDDYISKPVRAAELAAALERWVEAAAP